MVAGANQEGHRLTFINMSKYTDPNLHQAKGTEFKKKDHLGLCPENRDLFLERQFTPSFLKDVKLCWDDYKEVAKTGDQQFHQ